MKPVRVRIAPSPTGQDLHIGNVYTALINYAFAKKHQGRFVFRVEDTDRARLVPGAVDKIIFSLEWFGLNYDEGPKIGGPFAPYYQSERLDLYRQYAKKLVDSNHAYYCVCDAQRLTRMREEQTKNNQPVLYDGRCKKLKLTEADVKGQKFVIRLSVPDEGETEFTDMIRGKISFQNKLIDDQVLIKSDGFPTYHLAVVVDDHLMEISHIIRAEEWISSTPKHILIYQYLGWNLPVFAHGPILRNPDKSKLSKRKNPVWASWYKQEGFLPEAILNYLALMGWAYPDGRDIFSLEEFIAKFELKDIKPVGPSFDLKKLEWLNGEYIRKSQNLNLKIQIYNFLDKKYDIKIIDKTIPLIKERIKKLSDYMPLTEFFFRRPQKYEADLFVRKELINKIKNNLTDVKDWKAMVIGEKLMALCKELDIKTGEFFMIIRVAITGKKISPPLNESMEILGKNEVIERLRLLV